jgi:hypothetical protein
VSNDVKRERDIADQLIDCVPGSWLDDLLTGPNSPLKDRPAGRWDCRDIEGLLKAIVGRMQKVREKQAAKEDRP